MAVNPLDEVLSLLSTEGFSEKPQDSLGDVLNILEDLDTKLDVIKDDEPLDQVIDTLENLGDTFNFLQGAEQTTESIAKEAFEKLESSLITVIKITSLNLFNPSPYQNLVYQTFQPEVP